MNVPNVEVIPYAGSNPMGDLFAENGIRLSWQHLESAVLSPRVPTEGELLEILRAAY